MDSRLELRSQGLGLRFGAWGFRVWGLRVWGLGV